MNQPDPIELFEAIHLLSPTQVQEYFDQGGIVNTISEAGRTPLAEVASLLLASSAQQHEDGALPEQQDSLRQIGSILLNHGASYQGRVGRTKVSITIEKLISSRFPLINQDWAALHEKQQLMGVVSEQIEQAVPARRRRI